MPTGSAGQAVAASPLLETELYIPRWRPGLVSRQGLIERLDRGAGRKLAPVFAPAGFGKTMLLAEWLAVTAASEQPAAWVSLDQTDNAILHSSGTLLGLLHRRTADGAVRGWRASAFFAAVTSASTARAGRAVFRVAIAGQERVKRLEFMAIAGHRALWRR